MPPLRDRVVDALRLVFGAEREERRAAESPSAAALASQPSAMYSMYGRDDLGGLLSVSQILMDTYADYEAMEEYPDIGCLAEGTLVYVVTDTGIVKPVPIEVVAIEGEGVTILGFDVSRKRIVKIQANNPRLTSPSMNVVAVKMSNGRTIKATPDHLFLTADGWAAADPAKVKDGVKAAKLVKGAILIGMFAGFNPTGLTALVEPRCGKLEVLEDPTPAGKAKVYDITTATHNFIAEGTCVHNSAYRYFANDAVQPSVTDGRVIWTVSDDDSIRGITDDLMHKRLRTEYELWSQAYSAGMYGNGFEELLINENGVVGLNHLPVPTMRRVEGLDGSLIGYVQDITGQFTANSHELRAMLAGNVEIPKSLALFEDWQVVHFRLRATRRRSPYGRGIGEGARWVWKRLIMMEDASIIYWLNRVPRYAFYVDVTDVPPDRVEGFLKKMKRDLKKKKMVNPACLTGDTCVTCLDGKDRSMKEMISYVDEMKAKGEKAYVFSYDLAKNAVVPGEVEGAILSAEKVPVYRVVLDNGAVVRCTGDHPFLLRSGEYKWAQDLKPGESLMPLYLSRGSKGKQHYWTYRDVSRGQTHYVHQMVAQSVLDSDYKAKGLHVHHKDERKSNNHPTNLELVTPSEHAGHKHPVHLQAARAGFVDRVEADPAFRQELADRLAAWRFAHPDEASKHARLNSVKGLATKMEAAHPIYDRIFEIIDGRLKARPTTSAKALTEWLNAHEDFVRLYSGLPTTTKSTISVGCLGALLRSRGFRSFANYKLRVTGSKSRKVVDTSKMHGPKMRGQKIGGGRLNHTVVDVQLDGYEDVYDLKIADHHNFALTAGVFVHNTGRLDMRYKPLSQDEDFIVGVREGRDLARVEVVSAPEWTNNESLEYFKRMLHGTLNVPRAWLGQDEPLPSKNPLSSEDVRAARVTLNLQQELKLGYERICRVHLAARGMKNPDDADFSIQMTVPSGIYELAAYEVLNARADYATRIAPFTSVRWVQENILKMGEAEITAIEKQRKKEQQEGMGAPGGMGGGMGMPPAPMPPPPPSGGGEPPPPAESPDASAAPEPPAPSAPAREWKVYDQARRIEEMRYRESCRNHQLLVDKLGQVLSNQDDAFSHRERERRAFFEDFKKATLNSRRGFITATPSGRGRGSANGSLPTLGNDH